MRSTLSRQARFTSIFILRAAFAALLFLGCAPSATALPYFVSVTEWGAGYVCNASGSTLTVPQCGISPAGLGSFARLPSRIGADPTPGGSATALIYTLPFSVGTFDVQMVDNPITGDGDSDLLRFIGNELIFYSQQSAGGIGNCATGWPLVTGCDGLADVKTIPAAATGSPSIQEIQTRNLAGAGSTGEGVYLGNLPQAEFTFISDQSLACPTLVPNCGPMNIAPPITDPYRFLDPTPAAGFVFLPAGPNFDPFLFDTPEPGTGWLVSTGLAGLAALWRRRRSVLAT